jgi:ADP-ribosylglycohydrolase
MELGDAMPDTAASVLGSGRRVLAEDTVPFALWCADRHLGSFEEALWATVAGLGDRDTTCAIVGGITAAAGSVDDLPTVWRARREALPQV